MKDYQRVEINITYPQGSGSSGNECFVCTLIIQDHDGFPVNKKACLPLLQFYNLKEMKDATKYSTSVSCLARLGKANPNFQKKIHVVFNL